jgi:hypothetical protein
LGDSAVFTKTVRYFVKNFSNPNFPFKDEIIYEKILDWIIKVKWFDNSEKSYAKSRMKLLQQNNVGKPGNDFYFISPHGIKNKLYDIKCKLTLVFFYNPECNACKVMQNALLQAWKINSMVLKHELAILAIYTDKDIKVWRKYCQTNLFS